MARAAAEAVARSGSFDVSRTWICKCTIAGCFFRPCPVGHIDPRSHTSSASRTSEFFAGNPVLTFHKRLGVRMIKASAKSAATSSSSRCDGKPCAIPRRSHRPSDRTLPARRNAASERGRPASPPANFRAPSPGVPGRAPSGYVRRHLGRSVGLFLTVVAPRHVVKRPGTVSDTPMGHDAFGIEFERLLKALDTLRLVEGKAPVQTQVEPALRFWRARRNNPGMAAKVETIHPLELQHRAGRARTLSRMPRNWTADAYHLPLWSGDRFSLCLDN